MRQLCDSVNAPSPAHNPGAADLLVVVEETVSGQVWRPSHHAAPFGWLATSYREYGTGGHRGGRTLVAG